MDQATLASLPPNVLAAYLRDPRLSMVSEAAKSGSDYSPVQSPWQGVARMAQAAIGAFGQNQIADEYKDRGDKYTSAMADVVRGLGRGDYGSAINATANNPDLSDVGLQIALTKLKAENDPFKEMMAAQLRGYMPGGSTSPAADVTGAAGMNPPSMGSEGMSTQPPITPVQSQDLPPTVPSPMNVPQVDMNAKPDAGVNIPPPSAIQLNGSAPPMTVPPQTQPYQPSMMDYKVSKEMGIPEGKVLSPGGAIVSDPNAKQDLNQTNAASFYERMLDANGVVADPKIANVGLDLGQQVKGSVPLVGNKLVSPEYQQLDQAKRNFINAQLRRESGANINQSEFDNANKQYFPQPGDSDAVLQQKAQNRNAAISGMKNGVAPGYTPRTRQADPTAQRQLILDANDAISKGADPVKVRERLRQLGVTQ